MNSHELSKVLGVMGDHLLITSGSGRATEYSQPEIAYLYVNGGGQVLALTDAQLKQRGGDPQAFGSLGDPADTADPAAPQSFAGPGESPTEPGSDAA